MVKLEIVHPYGVTGTWYRLLSDTKGILLDFQILISGRRVDFIKIDKFWGYCPKPLR
jgi:hypothetical protein